MNAKKKKKIKETVKKLKERMKERKKTEGAPKIKGVDKPRTKQTYLQKLKAKKKNKHKNKRHVVVGPKGGVYAQTASGKKDYSAKKKTPKGVDRGATVKQRLANQKQKRIKKAIEELIEDSEIINQRGEKMNKEELKKSLLEQFKDKDFTDEEVKEAIQKAMTAGHDVIEPGKADEVKEVDVGAGSAIAAPAAVEEPKAEAAPEAPAPKKEVKFADGLFKQFSLGSTLVQGPTGNTIANVKASKK